jgi:hypothetical protein
VVAVGLSLLLAPEALVASPTDWSHVLGTGQREAIPRYNWYPGYYVLNHEDTAAAKRAILADPLVKPFTGVQFRYHWAASELSPGDYSAGFASLDRDLKQVAAKKKKLMVMLMNKKFDGTPAVPADLRTSPGPWCSGSYCGEFTTRPGTALALLWNPVVQARLNAWITAMARHVAESPYLDSVAGIVLNETALGTTRRRVLMGAEYDPYVYLEAIQDNLRAAIAAAPRLITIIYFEGGFVSMDRKPVNAGARMGEWMLRNPRTGAGTPDLKPNSPKGTNHPCTHAKYQSRIACAPAVQAPDYATVVTDSFEDSFEYGTKPVPDGHRASFLTFSYSAGRGPNAFTFADVARNIASHPIPNTVRPWPVMPPTVVQKVSLTSPVRAGREASLTVRVSPRARCTIGVSHDAVAPTGLGPKSGGTITWRWRVGASARPGRWPVIVRCRPNGTLKLTIRVLSP